MASKCLASFELMVTSLYLGTLPYIFATFLFAASREGTTAAFWGPDHCISEGRRVESSSAHPLSPNDGVHARQRRRTSLAARMRISRF